MLYITIELFENMNQIKINYITTIIISIYIFVSLCSSHCPEMTIELKNICIIY